MEYSEYGLMDVIQDLMTDPEVISSPQDAGLLQLGMIGLFGLVM